MVHLKFWTLDSKKICIHHITDSPNNIEYKDSEIYYETPFLIHKLICVQNFNLEMSIIHQAYDNSLLKFHFNLVIKKLKYLGKQIKIRTNKFEKDLH